MAQEYEQSSMMNEIFGQTNQEHSSDFLQNLVQAATTAAAQNQFQPAVSGPLQAGANNRSGTSDAGLSSSSQREARAVSTTWIPRGKGKRSKIAHSSNATSAAGPEETSSDTVIDHADSTSSIKKPTDFRRDNKKKKQTRPSVENLYDAVQLTPERFLDFMSAAKAFMLDPAHPERKECIGQRGKGDNKEVKLELLKTTTDFLEEGHGLHFFGAHSEPPGDPNGTFNQVITVSSRQRELSKPSVSAPPAVHAQSQNRPKRDFTWPEDRNETISRCLMVMRKVASNEKQRLYALDTRKAARTEENTGVDGTNADQTSRQTFQIRVFVVDERVRRPPTILSQSIEDADLAWKVIKDVVAGGGGIQSNGFGRAEMTWRGSRNGLSSEAIHIQTPSGMAVVTDEENCRDAIKQVLDAPWLEGVVRVVLNRAAVLDASHIDEGAKQPDANG
ncbi:Hypothetical protein D9617_5g068490 [Elsinoe fawcettii]|nr:Hypothetical protein D9617_5g068490 [Elsinoe fawcettii]